MNDIQSENIQVHLHSRNGSIVNSSKGKSHILFDLDQEIRADFQNFSGSVQMEVSILSANIPHYWYNVREGYNTLLIAVYNNTTSSHIGICTYTFPVGNYTGSEIAYILNNGNTATAYCVSADSLLSEMNSQLGTVANTNDICDHAFHQNKFTFQFTPAGVEDYSFCIIPDGEHSTTFNGLDLSGYNSTMSYQLGLGEFTAFTFSSTLAPLPYSFDLNPINMIYVKTNFARSNISSWDLNEGNVLGTIPVTSDFTGDVSYSAGLSNETTTIRGDGLSIIEVELVDWNNIAIPLNNIDWCMTIQFRVIRNKFKRQLIDEAHIRDSNFANKRQRM